MKYHTPLNNSLEEVVPEADVVPVHGQLQPLLLGEQVEEVRDHHVAEPGTIV